MTDTPNHPPREHHAFLGAAKVIALCTMASRVLGVVRDVMMANYFGAGAVSDAFFTAWRIPNLFRRLFGEGAASSALVPTFTASLKTRGYEDSQKLFSVTFSAMVLILGALTLIMEGVVAGMRWWGDFTPRTVLLLEYLAVLSPYMLLICLGAFFMALLNAHRHFFAPAAMPVVLNVVWIAALYLIMRNLVDDQTTGGRWLTAAILVGGGLQLLFMVPFTWKHRIRLRPAFDFAHPDFRQVLRLWVPVMIGSAVIQINTAVDAYLAWILVPYDGAPTHLFYGNRVMDLPIALIGSAISTAVLTTLSEHAAAGERDQFKVALMSALRVSLFLSIPAGLGLIALSSPVVEMIYRHGEFSPDSAVKTAWVLFCYGLGIWAQTGVFVLLRAFYAQKDTRTPLYVALVMVALNFVLNLILIRFFYEAGLALATSICGVIQFCVLFWILRRRLGRLGGRRVIIVCAKTLAVSLVMAAAAAVAWYALWPEGASTLIRVAVLALIVTGAMGLFVALAAALKMQELKALLRFKR